MATAPVPSLLRIILAIIVIKWMIKLFVFFVLLLFALFATPIWLLSKSNFNPWTVVLFPFGSKQ